MRERKKNKKSVFLYDNESDLANNIKLYLEDSYKVYNIKSIDNLILDLRHNFFDFVVLDFDSIYQNFNKIINEVRRKSSTTKILLMCTIFNTENFNEKEILNKVDDFIFKPFNVDLLKLKLTRFGPLKSRSDYQGKLV